MAAMIAPLQAHIRTVKQRLFIIGATIMAAFVLTFAYAPELVAWLRRPLADDLVFYSPTEAFFATVKVAFFAAIVLSLPVIFHQFWKFIEPALLTKERRWAVPLFLLAAGLFVLGLVFCNLVILPLVVAFFVDFGMERSIMPELGVGTYIDFNTKFLVVMGCAFELPLVMALLARAGIVHWTVLSRLRRHAVLGALIVSAVVTPDATMFTMLLMAVPLMILYEIGVWGAWWFGRMMPVPKPSAVSIDGTLPIETAGHRVR